MTIQQPEALRLADRLEQYEPKTQALYDAAAELRRLSTINAQLLQALTELSKYVSLAPYEVQRRAIDAISAAKGEA